MPRTWKVRLSARVVRPVTAKTVQLSAPPARRVDRVGNDGQDLFAAERDCETACSHLRSQNACGINLFA